MGSPMEIGDTQLEVKVRLRDEREGLRFPAGSVVFMLKRQPAGLEGKPAQANRLLAVRWDPIIAVETDHSTPQWRHSLRE